jgi:hypothetical protein
MSEENIKSTAVERFIQALESDNVITINNTEKYNLYKRSAFFLEKQQVKDAFEEGDWNWREDLDITSEDYYNINFNPTQNEE